jgi:hypothetical protein
MSPGVGFFVEYTAAGDFDVTNADRAHAADWFWKSEVSDMVRLQASGNDKSDELIVRFSSESTPGMDMQGDARKLLAETEGLPQIYTTNGGLMFAINSLPATTVVPVGFTSVTSGTYTIEATETSEFENVVLEDKLLGVQTDLLTSAYSFDYAAGESADRFLLHFTALGTPELEANSINIWSADKKIFVQAPQVNGDIAVYNMMGQQMVRTEIEPGLNVIPMQEVNAYFVVKVFTSKNAVTGKVFVK